MCITEITNRPKLHEIDYSPGIEPLQITDAQLIADAKIVGDLDNRDVWLNNVHGENVYFTISNDTVDGLIILNNNYYLIGIKKYASIPGLITMLVGFVVHRLKKKVTIGRNEPLTSEGLDWLCSLIRAGGRGLTVTDQHGQMPNEDAIRQEWQGAMKNSLSGGPTAITIESRMTRKLRTRAECLAEGRSLMPTNWFIGDENIV